MVFSLSSKSVTIFIEKALVLHVSSKSRSMIIKKHWFLKQNGGNRPTDALLVWVSEREEEKVAVWSVGGGEEPTDE